MRVVPDPVEALAVWETPVDRAELGAVIESLPRIYRSAITLRYLAGLTYREAASTAGISEKGFETRLLRARVMLRQALSRRERRDDAMSGL